MLVELSVLEQRYRAVSLVVYEGAFVVDLARRLNVSRQTPFANAVPLALKTAMADSRIWVHHQ